MRSHPSANADTMADMPRPTVHSPEQRRRALRKIIDEYDLSVNGWARKAGVSEASVRNFLKGGEHGSDSLSDRTYSLLANAIDLTVAELQGEQDLPIRTKKQRAGEPVLPPTIETRGAVAAGVWLDLDVPMDPAELEQFPVSVDTSYPLTAQYGLIVRGTSMNRVAAPGDLLHCLDFVVAGIEPDADDVVIVERRRLQEGQREVTAKRIKRDGDIVTLSPDSTDPRWKPIVLDTTEEPDGEEIRVVALVLAVYKPLRKKLRSR